MRALLCWWGLILLVACQPLPPGKPVEPPGPGPFTETRIMPEVDMPEALSADIIRQVDPARADMLDAARATEQIWPMLYMRLNPWLHHPVRGPKEPPPPIFDSVAQVPAGIPVAWVCPRDTDGLFHGTWYLVKDGTVIQEWDVTHGIFNYVLERWVPLLEVR